MELISKWLVTVWKKEAISPESIAKDTSRLKEEKLELEAEREALLKFQSKP